METKEFNLEEILKDCPQGMELYSLMHGVVEFDHIYDGKIYFKGWGLNTFVDAQGRYITGMGECILFPSKENRDWSTFKVPKKKIERFDPNTLRPFDKVLVRDKRNCLWDATFFSHIDRYSRYPFRTTSGGFVQVIPYKGNEHLAGKVGEPDEYFRYWEDEERDADG